MPAVHIDEVIAGESVREYIESWDSDKLRQKLRERHGVDPFEQEVQATKKELKSLMDEFGDAVRGGAPALKPFLQNLWNTRAVAYRDALQQFIVGYKEGFQEANKPDIPPEVAQEMHQQQQQEGQRLPGQQAAEQSEQQTPGQQGSAVGQDQEVQQPPLQQDVQKAVSGRQAEKDLTKQEVQPGQPQQGCQDQDQRQRREQ
ncbi:hypothetical protein N2152v2_007638 [Parachlorella kessleri]